MDACKVNNAGCSQLCVNDNGRPECQCYTGYSLSNDSKTCEGKRLQTLNSVGALSPVLTLIGWVGRDRGPAQPIKATILVLSPMENEYSGFWLFIKLS